MSDFAVGLLGKRLLIAPKTGSYASTTNASEVTVLEVSSSGAWVKLGDKITGKKYWVRCDNIIVFETLVDKLQRDAEAL